MSIYKSHKNSVYVVFFNLYMNLILYLINFFNNFCLRTNYKNESSVYSD